MAIHRYVTTEHPDGTFTVGPETREEPCHVCGGEARRQVCPGCRKYHYHGEVHSPAGGPMPVCDGCLPAVARAWEQARLARA